MPGFSAAIASKSHFLYPAEYSSVSCVAIWAKYDHEATLGRLSRKTRGNTSHMSERQCNDDSRPIHGQSRTNQRTYGVHMNHSFDIVYQKPLVWILGPGVTAESEDLTAHVHWWHYGHILSLGEHTLKISLLSISKVSREMEEGRMCIRQRYCDISGYVS